MFSENCFYNNRYNKKSKIFFLNHVFHQYRFLDQILKYHDWTFRLNWYIILKYLIYYKILYNNNI